LPWRNLSLITRPLGINAPACEYPVKNGRHNKYKINILKIPVNRGSLNL